MRIIVLLSLLCIRSVLNAAFPTEGAPVVIYRGEDQLGPLGKDLSILEDPTGRWTIQNVLSDRDFVPSISTIPNLGTSHSAYWVKAEIYNTSVNDDLVILIDHPEIEELDLYLEKGGQVLRIVHGGQMRPRSFKDQDSPAFSYSLPIPYGGYGTLYIRAKSSKLLQLPIFIQSRAESTTQKLLRNLFMGGYMGIMIVMILYNLFVFISIRERNYLYYVIYLFSVCITQLSFTGYAAFYVWPGQNWLILYSTTSFTILTMIFATEFMQRFSNSIKYISNFVKVKYTIYVISSFGGIMYILGYNTFGYTVIQTTSAMMASYILYVSIKIARTAHRPARYFLVAWCIFMTGILIFVAKDWGILPNNDFTKYMMTIGSAVEVVLLSFGLADKINVLRREKERSQADALQMAKENELFVLNQNTELERKVTERTYALQESNDNLKRTQTQLVSAEKMASLGQLTAGIAHEINNPLNFISSNIPPLKRDLEDLKEILDAYRSVTKDDIGLKDVRALEERIGVDFTVNEVQEILKCMETGAERTSEIVRGLRTFSRLDEDDLKDADVNEGLRSTVVVLGPQFRDAVQIEYGLGHIPEVECYPGKLNQVFMNLLNNAAHAVKQRHGNSGGIIRIATALVGRSVTIVIGDNGMGMDEAVQSRLFEPFFTTKGVGEGTGLGLSIVQGIIEKHNGSIKVESALGQGTTFTITLPVSQAVELAKSA